MVLLVGGGRRVSAHLYKDVMYVHIREYVRNKHNVLIPTKIGIGLTVDQWNSMVSQVL